MGISTKDLYHFTLHDLALEILFRNERDNKLAWLNGARVLEAIGVAFTKNQKYSSEPHLYTKKELEENEREAFNDFVRKWVKE